MLTLLTFLPSEMSTRLTCIASYIVSAPELYFVMIASRSSSPVEMLAIACSLGEFSRTGNRLLVKDHLALKSRRRVIHSFYELVRDSARECSDSGSYFL